MNGAQRIAAERQRQIEVEGYDPERDEDPRELAAAALDGHDLLAPAAEAEQEGKA